MEAIVVELTKFGLPGLFIAYLAYVNRGLVGELKETRTELAAINEKRVMESAASVRALGEAAAAQDKIGDVLEAVSRHLDELRWSNNR